MEKINQIQIGADTRQIEDAEAVHFTEQTLTAEQQAQVQKNIGVDTLVGDINTILDNINGEVI